jgi:predicted exporter
VTDASATAHSERLLGYLRNQLPMLLVAVVLVVAVVFLVQDRWRRGAFVIGGAPLLASVLRLVLPEVRVGLLAVRGRPFDVATYAVLGGTIIALAATISSLGVG